MVDVRTSGRATTNVWTNNGATDNILDDDEIENISTPQSSHHELLKEVILLDNDYSFHVFLTLYCLSSFWKSFFSYTFSFLF